MTCYNQCIMILWICVMCILCTVCMISCGGYPPNFDQTQQTQQASQIASVQGVQTVPNYQQAWEGAGIGGGAAVGGSLTLGGIVNALLGTNATAVIKKGNYCCTAMRLNGGQPIASFPMHCGIDVNAVEWDTVKDCANARLKVPYECDLVCAQF